MVFNMEDIVKALNNFIDINYSVEGKFMQTKSYTVDTKFGGYKHYTLCLYYVVGNKSVPIIEETVTVKTLTEEDSNKYLNIKFLEAVYDYVASDEFRELMYGKIII